VTFSVPLREGLRLGRHEGNDLVLNDRQVSRHHLQISMRDQGFLLEDLGSRHGTLINGEKVERRRLSDGDSIQIGNVLLTFHEQDEPQKVIHYQTTAAGPPARRDDADRRLVLLYEISHAIGAIGDTDELLGRMLAAILDVLGCERALVGVWEAPQGSLRRIVRTRGSIAPDEIVVSRGIVDAILMRREQVIINSETGRNAPATLVRERVRSAMAVPLAVGERVLGFLYVDNREHVARFTPKDLDFLTSLGHLTAAALESAERFQKAAAVAEVVAAANPLDEILGESAPIKRLKTLIRKYATAQGTNVLIRGESGTGKELVARALHTVSPRAGGPFVALNCAAIPETMIESELFGHDKGAFTGAVRDKRGKFAMANGGTLFLDEIGDLDLAAQAKVLRAIQEGEIQPLGSEMARRVNVRVVAATHKDLLKEIAAKRFREDLYYRLNVVEIEVPPLREREGDVELLAQALLRSASLSMGKRLQGFTPAALAALRRHLWPGNVRELRNEMERAAIIAESTVIDLSDLSARIGAGGPGRPCSAPPAASLAERFAELEPTERTIIAEAIKTARGNLSEAARLLGITRIRMRRRVERFGLKTDDDEHE